MTKNSPHLDFPLLALFAALPGLRMGSLRYWWSTGAHEHLDIARNEDLIRMLRRISKRKSTVLEGL